MGLRGVIAVVVAACSSSPHSKPDTTPVTQSFSNDLDVLFAIDNSPQTADMQTLFATNFPNFITALDAFPAGRPNLHIGIVSSTVDIGVQGWGPGCPSPDPNENGLLQNNPRVAGCTPPIGRFISDIGATNGGRAINYDGTLQDTFSCIGQLGSTGCGFEAQLEGMKRALDGSRPENAGFLRDDATLAIVFLTDEDDCSVADRSIFGLSGVGTGDFRCTLYAYNCDTPISASTPGTYTNCTPRAGSYLQDVAYYTQFVASLKSSQRIAIAMIMGDRTSTITTRAITTGSTQELALGPSCMTTIGSNPASALPGIRLGAFTDAFGALGRTYSACQLDYSATVTDIAALVSDAMKPCITGTIDATDTDPANPGVQPACTVSLEGQTLPPCHMSDPTTPAGGQPTCAWFAVDSSCSTPTNLVVSTTSTTDAAYTVTCN